MTVLAATGMLIAPALAAADTLEVMSPYTRVWPGLAHVNNPGDAGGMRDDPGTVAVSWPPAIPWRELLEGPWELEPPELHTDQDGIDLFLLDPPPQITPHRPAVQPVPGPGGLLLMALAAAAMARRRPRSTCSPRPR